MPTPTASDVIKAFVAVTREELLKGNDVDVPGFGTLSVEHKESEMKEDDDGSTYMAPPRDVVTFDPE